VCVRCGLPFASSYALDSVAPECGACREGKSGFDGARSFGLYAGKLRQIILRAKFTTDERLSLRLGELLFSVWNSLPQAEEFQFPVLVPVPLHAARQRERGFNQSELLARGLARAVGRKSGACSPPVASTWMVRQRATRPQTGLSVAARRENLRGAFEVVEPDQVRGRGIVLVDDVMTTGATLSACARALHRAGAAQVWGLTLARATPQFSDLTRSDNDSTVDGLGWDST
jgi:ComF family protein